MDTLVCPKHKLDYKFICKHKACGESYLCCDEEECIQSHLHDLNINIVSIQDVINAIQQKRRKTLMLSGKTYEQVDFYFDFIKQKFMMKVDQEKDKTIRLVQRLVYQLDQNNQDISTTINSLQQKSFSKISKEAIGSVVQSLKKEEDQENSARRFQDFQKQIQSRKSEVQKLIQKLQKSMQYKSIFTFQLMDLKNIIRIQRFSTQTSTWGHNMDKVDAIQFKTTQDVILRGYVQFQIYNWQSQSIVKLEVKVYQNDAQIYKQAIQLKKDQHKSNKIDIIFENPISVRCGETYDLSVKCLNSYFQTKYGQSGKAQVQMFKFSKSKHDNNGTDVGSGQIHSMLINAKR